MGVYFCLASLISCGFPASSGVNAVRQVLIDGFGFCTLPADLIVELSVPLLTYPPMWISWLVTFPICVLYLLCLHVRAISGFVPFRKLFALASWLSGVPWLH
jgi:hypothetical protein